MLLYRAAIPRSEWPPLALFASTASLGLVVVITQIGLRARDMNADVANALTAAALLSSLLCPTLAALLLSRTPSAARRDGPG